jgi:hypothetical protein
MRRRAKTCPVRVRRARGRLHDERALSRFTTERGKILPARLPACAHAISGVRPPSRARYLAPMPYARRRALRRPPGAWVCSRRRHDLVALVALPVVGCWLRPASGRRTVLGLPAVLALVAAQTGDLPNQVMRAALVFTSARGRLPPADFFTTGPAGWGRRPASPRASSSRLVPGAAALVGGFQWSGPRRVVTTRRRTLVAP